MKSSNLPEKAVHVLDNAPGYKNEQEIRLGDQKIQTMFLPPKLHTFTSAYRSKCHPKSEVVV